MSSATTATTTTSSTSSTSALAPHKERLRALMARKAELERGIRELGAVAGRDQHEELVDSDGFPRSDVDVWALASVRRDLLLKQNDHKMLMKQIEDAMLEYHRLLKEHKPVQQPDHKDKDKTQATGDEQKTQPPKPTLTLTNLSYAAPANLPNPKCEDLSKLRPMMSVDQVVSGGPADEAGLRVGDVVVRLGSVVAQNFSKEAMVRAVQHSENEVLQVVVRRGSEVVQLRLTPHRWSGPGLLGCHLNPIEQ